MLVLQGRFIVRYNLHKNINCALICCCDAYWKLQMLPVFGCRNRVEIQKNWRGKRPPLGDQGSEGSEDGFGGYRVRADTRPGPEYD
jgi:hypothetical protein